MRKNKQAQRTKNNARPSNSSRSAELLGTSIPNFVGFSAVKDGGYVPVLPGLSLCTINEVELNNVDNNFQIVLKKMNKKDSTTKYKALQEFAMMCRESDLSAVEGMLPFWPRLYCALSIDVEHRVREAAQLAHAAVVKRVGKGIALYLKQLAGAWFTSQHDIYPPAASAASNSFNDTFPQKKVIDAIVHCQSEILTYICDNITIHTAQTISLQKNLTEEEMEAKYQRVLIASLQGYSFYLRKIPIQEIEKMTDIHHKIIQNNKFWKLVKYDALPVRTALFNVLTSLIENADTLLEDVKKRTVTTIMNSLDETEPALLSAVWESMLVTINKIEDWYSVVSIEKLVLPKLWRVLRSGGQCCASIVYPNLLPLVSQFPKLNIDIRDLYIQFFSNMREGFSVKSVQIIRTEMFAVTTSFVECLRYSILLNDNDQDLCGTLLRKQLMPVLETCIKENTAMKQILFCEITHLVRYWSKNRHNKDYKSYTCLVQEFWSELDRLFSTLIDASQDCQTFGTFDTNNSQIEFLLTLKTAPVHNRKNLKVKFSDTEENTEVQPQTRTTEIDADTEFLVELNNFVHSHCIKYFNKIIEQHTQKYVTSLNSLLKLFENDELFVKRTESSKAEINFFSFYNEILRKWLLEKSKDTEHIVELIFHLTKYMSDSEKNEVLESLTQFDDIVVTRGVIQCALLKKNRNDVIVKKWCSESKITSLLIDVAKEIASGNYADLEKNRNLILLAIEPSDDGNLLITEDGVNEIVSILCNSFHNVDETCLLQFAKLISCIVPLTWIHNKSISGAMRVLETLFELCSQDYFSDNTAFIDTMRDVWKNGLLEAIRRLSQLEFLELTNKFGIIMWKRIHNSNEESVNKILLDTAADFLEVVINNEDDINEDYAKEIVLTFLTDSGIRTRIAEVTGIILYAEVITGNLYVSTLDQKIEIYEESVSIDLTSNDVIDSTAYCLKWALFNTILLHNLCLRSTLNDENEESSDKDENVSSTEQPLIQNVDLPGSTNLLINVVYSIIVGQIYTKHYKSTKDYSNVNKMLTTVQNNFKQLQAYIDEDTYNEILNHVKMNCTKYCSMLPYIIQFCCTELCTNKKCEQAFKNCKTDDISTETNEMRLQELQILSKFQCLENISMSTDDDVCALILARSVFINHEDNSNCISILEKIISYEKENPAMLMLDCDISEISWAEITLPLEVIRLLTQLVTRIPSKLTDEHWNFILMSLVLWQFSIIKSKQSANDFKVCSLTIAICQLHHALQSVIDKNCYLSETLLDEWRNVFDSDMQRGIIQTWMFYSDLYSEKATALKSVILLNYLGEEVKMLNGSVLFETQLSASLVLVNLKDTVDLSLKLIQSPIANIQLGAYHVLKHTVPELVKEDKATVQIEGFDVNTQNIKKLEDVLRYTQDIVNTILMDFKICDTINCTIQPYTDSYTYTLGYLLSWAVVLDMCAKAHGDLLHRYAEILKEDFFPNLLNNIFRLMLVEVPKDNKSKGAKLAIFSNELSLNFEESWTEWRLDHIVCWLYVNSLRRLPVLVRQWWSTVDSRVSAEVDKLTTYYVSPVLCQEELANTKLHNIENMQVKVHPTFREVTAAYQMGDTKLELTITLPPNHPLGPVTVEPGQYAGGAANWRNSHMQLCIFLTHQNGSVSDSLALWKKHLDKKFAGVEECCICFSVFHINTHQIPKVSCKICRKKFHTACIYTWFYTSQASTCPICRNVF